MRIRILICAAVALMPIALQAHGGKLDKYGGHYDKKTGTYHYHTGKYAGYTVSRPGEIPKAFQGKAKGNSNADNYYVEKPAPIEITAEKLFEEAQADWAEAQTKYRGKLVRVTGQVYSKMRTATGPVVDFRGVQKSPEIRPKSEVSDILTAYFRGYEAPHFNNIDIGEYYIFDGTVDFGSNVDWALKDRTIFIKFTDCEFIKERIVSQDEERRISFRLITVPHTKKN